MKSKNLSEQFYEDSFYHQYTALFDKTGFYGVRVFIKDTSYTKKKDVIFDMYGKYLKQNSRISGIGVATGDAECPSVGEFQGVTWETKDNFELLLQFNNEKNIIRMIRLAKTHVPQPLKLCKFMRLLR